MNNNSVRYIGAKVELFNNSSALPIDNYTNKNRIKDFTVERFGEEGKFFGFGICQKLSLKLIDVKRELSFTTENSFKVFLNEVSFLPVFYMTEHRRDEKTNELSITAYDLIYKANSHRIDELQLSSYSIQELAAAVAHKIGASGVRVVNVKDGAFSTQYTTGGNYEGSENLREVLNHIAEATQTIYFIDSENKLVFKRLIKEGNPTLTIGKANYFELDSKSNRRLTQISHITELGDNITASMKETGSTQEVRNNPLWELREDISALVQKALDAVGGLTLNQFSCVWRGNPALELGEKIALETKDGNTVSSYLLNDSLNYNGGLQEETSWKYSENTKEDSNPSTLGEALKETFAKVDKQKKEIEIVASKANKNSNDISALKINTDGLRATVEKVETQNEEINKDLTTIKKSVETKMDEEQVAIKIKKELEKGADKIITNTGFVFDDNGLSIDKTGSEMKTQITEDGMKVLKNNQAVLTANNTGVDAVNLHATTYLIIGNNARFEDYGTNRTAAFYIGG